MKNMKNKKNTIKTIAIVILCCIVICLLFFKEILMTDMLFRFFKIDKNKDDNLIATDEINSSSFSTKDNIIKNNKDTYDVVNNNIPYFTEEEKSTLEEFESYSDLDELGRCGTAYANICKNLMPTEKRGDIGHIKPSGWHTVKYPEVIKDRYLYNRCHLIAYMLAGENDNPKNLITGTRYFNVEGMLPFEEQVHDAANKGLHILYRVTPRFSGSNLVADGVLMEAYSVEDKGQTVQFCVFVNNFQPGIVIDYATGESRLE